MRSVGRRQTDNWECSFDFVRRRTGLSGRAGSKRLYFECYLPTGLLLLPLVMLGFVGSAVGPSNTNHLAGEQSRSLNRAMKQTVDWSEHVEDIFTNSLTIGSSGLTTFGANTIHYIELADEDSFCACGSWNHDAEARTNSTEDVSRIALCNVR